MIQPAEFRAILEIRRMEFIWALTAFAGVVLLGTLNGILVAVVVSLVALAQQTADPPVRVLGRKPGTNVFRPRSAEHPEDETFPGLLLLRPEGPVFFANVSRLMEKIRLLVEEAKPRVMALDLGGVPDIEYTGLKMLAEAEQRARESGVSVWLVGLNPEVLSVIQNSSLGRLLGRERMHYSLELAVANTWQLWVQPNRRYAKSEARSTDELRTGPLKSWQPAGIAKRNRLSFNACRSADALAICMLAPLGLVATIRTGGMERNGPASHNQ